MAVVDTQIRPPYVRFTRRAVEDRTTEQKAGKYGFKDVDVALITVPGQKDVVERFVGDWLTDLAKRAEAGLVPFDWPEKFQRMYDFWKSGQEAPVEGTPIKGWSLLQPSQQENLILHGVLTIEDLANLSDEAVQRIGIGAQGLKQKAGAWLKEANDVGKVAAENETLRRDLEAMKEKVDALMAEKAAEAQGKKPASF